MALPDYDPNWVNMPVDSELDKYVKMMNTYWKLNITRDTLKKFIRDDKHRDEFDFREFPSPFPGGIRPLYHIIEERESKPQPYEEIMDKASLAIAMYNQENQTQFKVIKIENVNRGGGGRFLYITFSAVQGKRTKPEDTKMVELKSSTIHQEPDGWYFIRGMIMPFLDVLTSLSSDLKIGKKKNKEKLNPDGALDWRATQDEIEDENAICKIFQAVVHCYHFLAERTVEFCSPVDEKKVGGWKKHGLPSEVPGAGPVEEKMSKVPARPGTKEAHGEQVRLCLRNLTLIYKDDCAKGKVALDTLATLITKFIRNFRNEKCEKIRKIRLAGDDFQDGVEKLKGGIEFLEACGFEKIEGGEFLYLPKGEDIGLFRYAVFELGWIIHNVEYSGWFIYSGFK